MTDRRQALKARRESLVARGAAQRDYIGNELDAVGAGARHLDHYVAVARRLRPLLIVGAVAAVVALGPVRAISLGRKALVGGLMLRQFLGRR